MGLALMFAASILICFGLSGECVIVNDTRGPYETRELCQERIIEMKEAVRTGFASYGPAFYRSYCRKEKPGSLV